MNANLASAFRRNSGKFPSRNAVWSDGAGLSYSDLAVSAQRIAAWLARGRTKTRRVAILGSRSAEACAGVLGSSWAGFAYVPVSPLWPEARIKAVIKTARPDAIIADPGASRRLPENSIKRLCGRALLASDAARLPEARVSPAEVRPDDVAYIMFTSGTTGAPKGVVITAGSVGRLLAAMRRRCPLAPEDRVAENSDLTFDVSVLNMFMAWGAGASLRVVPRSQAMAPARFLRDQRITVWSAGPWVLEAMRALGCLKESAFPLIRRSLFMGEPLPLRSVRAWRRAAPNSVSENLYGPTEGTVVCIGQGLGGDLIVTAERATAAIGRPLPGTSAAILGEGGEFLARRRKGELALSGAQLASAYLDSPGLTRRRFRVIRGRRWYLTGDLAYQDDAGVFHHLGRLDHQVKVRGHRIELEEVEFHLRSAAGCDAVAAVAWPPSSPASLVGFVSGSGASEGEIRAALTRSLPPASIPAEIRKVRALPISANGKVDRQALLRILGAPLR